MKTNMALNSVPSVLDLDKALKDIVEWNLFAIRLPRITLTDIKIIEKEKRDNVKQQKVALYEKWLEACPEASWDHVIEALDEIGKASLAEQLRKAYGNSTSGHKASTVQSNGESNADCNNSSPIILPRPAASNRMSYSPGEANNCFNGTTPTCEVSEEVLTELSSLHEDFADLLCCVRSEIQRKVANIDGTSPNFVNDLVFYIQQQKAYKIPSLELVTSVDDLFKAIDPHFNFLNCYLAVTITRKLSGAINERADGYKSRVQQLMKTTKIRSLRNTLKRFQHDIRSCLSNTIVEIVVENGWGDQNIWLVEVLVKYLFSGSHPDQFQWFNIVSGSVVLTFVVPKHLTSSLVESCQGKTEFMRLIGVISLKIGDELVWKKEEEQHEQGRRVMFTFENSLILATLADSIETVQFLLKHIKLDVNAKNRYNSLINSSEVKLYYKGELNAHKQLNSLYSTFTSLLEDVTSALTAQKSDTECSPSTGVTTVGVTIYDTFLRGKVLLSLADELPEPLSLRIKQHCLLIERFKRGIVISYLVEPLRNYQPNISLSAMNFVEVSITLHSVWKACSVWCIEQLISKFIITQLETFNHSHWYQVTTDEGFVRLIFLTPRKLVNENDLITQCDDLSLLGVISVGVGNVAVFNGDLRTDEYYTFNGALDVAIERGCGFDGTELLMEVCHFPVDFTNFSSSDDNNNHYFLPDPDSTPLMIACCNDNSQLAHLLLHHGADPNIQTRKGVTALMYASRNSDLFQLLIDHGADVTATSFINFTLMHCACLAGNVKVIETLIESKDFVNQPNNRGEHPLEQKQIDGWTPLMVGVANGHTAAVQRLLEAKVDRNVQNNEGQTPLMLAIKYRKMPVVELLLRPSYSNKTSNRQTTTEEPLQVTADPCIQDNKGETPLMEACRQGYKEGVEVLLRSLQERKGGLDIKNINGYTSLMTASDCGHVDIVRDLLKAGADPLAQSNDYRYALDMATEKGHIEIAKILGNTIRCKATTTPQHANN